MRDIAINRIMTTSPATVGPDDPASAAKDLFESGGMHHLPVVEDGKLVGIVSSSDLMKFWLLDSGSGESSTATVSTAIDA